MSNSNRTQTIGADQQEAVISLDGEPGGSQSNGGTNKEVGKKSTSRRKKLLLLSAGIVIAIAAAYFAWNAFRYEDTDDAQLDGHVMQLSARISGQVAEVQVIEGQIVHAGDVLVTIDPQDYKIAFEQAQANLADALATSASSHWTVPITSVTVRSNLDSAKTAVTNAEAAVRAAEQNYESAKAALVQAEANAGKSDADLERAKQLVAKEDISRLQYDQAVATATVNRAAILSAQAAVHAAEQSVQQAQGKLLQAENDLQTAETAPEQISLSRSNALAADAKASQRKAQLAQTELNLKYTVIRSPVTGIVGKRNVEVGQNVSIGQELVDVVPLDDVWVTANFKETQLERMRAGQHVKIKVDAYGRAWSGHVTNMGGGTGSVFSLLPPENATGNYVKVVQRVPVRIDFDRPEGQDFNAEGLLKPGLSVLPDVRVR
jgi:membrane fusion protein (multidrug efflux system)